MRALSIRQPWAQLIVEGKKDVENRTRPLKYRGLVAIHASQNFDHDGYHYLTGKGIPLPPYRSFTRGAFVGMVKMVDCVRDHDSPWFHGPFGYVFEQPEQWEPIPFKGRLGLFEAPKKADLIGRE